MNEEAVRRPKVFVSQDNDFDYRMAEEYGDLVFLSNREVLAYSGSAQNALTIHGIESGIESEYIPGLDYLLPTGGPLSIAHMYRAAFNKTGDHQILKWDRRSARYDVYTMK